MKMTMHIDERLLKRVIKGYGFSSKTEAVDAALREMDRKAKLRAAFRKGLGATPEELATSVDPGYDIEALRVAEPPAQSYGRGTR